MKRINETIEEKEKFDEILSAAKDVVKFHQEIIFLVKKFEEAWSISILLQFLYLITLLATIGIDVTVVSTEI